MRVRPVDLRSAIEGRAVLGPKGVGRLEWELRDRLYRVASLRGRYAPIAIRTLAGQLSRYLRVEQGDAALVGDCERAVEGHFKPAHCWIIALAQAASKK
jgi:hypothetical protein